MSGKTIGLERGDRADEQLVEALGNVWFQGLVLALLVVAVPVVSGFLLPLWQWPVLVAVPVATWCFGTWYGQLRGSSRDSDLF